MTIREILKDDVDYEVEPLHKAIESIEYMVAMESDPTAPPSSNSSDSKKDEREAAKKKSQTSAAASELMKMNADAEKYNKEAYKDKKENTIDDSKKEKDKEDKDTDNPKDKEKFGKWLSEIFKLITDFVTNGFTNFKSGTRNMAEDSKRVVETINNIKKNYKLDPSRVITCWEYNDSYYDKFGSAIQTALSEYKQTIDFLRSTVDTIGNGENGEEEIIKKLSVVAKRVEGLKDDPKVKEIADENYKLMTDPIARVASLLGIDENEMSERGSKSSSSSSKNNKSEDGGVHVKHFEASTSKLENCIMYHYHNDKESQERFAIAERKGFIEGCEAFLRTSNSRIQALTGEINQIETVVNTYKGICSDLKTRSEHIHSPKLRSVLQGDINAVTKNISSFMNLIKFKQTMLHGRFFACEIIFKQAYNAENKPSKA